MNIKELRELTPQERYFHWIEEREKIRIKKEAGKPKPWTTDPILQSYSFCNVRREDDKTTRWLKYNVREPLKKDRQVMFAVVLFRWFNLIETGELLKNMGGLRSGNDGFGYFTKWNLKGVKTLLQAAKNQGTKVFTGAYNISASGSSKPKVDRVCDDYLQPVWEARNSLLDVLQDLETLDQAHKCFMDFSGLGGSGFMSGQIIADLRHTSIMENYSNDSFRYWASPGPGSKRGLNRLHGKFPGAPISKVFFSEEIVRLVDLVADKCSLGLVHGQDIQSTWCEFSKYETGVWGDGHLKRRYAGC